MARRVPPWVVVLAFAVLAGGVVGLAAYLRGRTSADFCTARLPDLPEYARTTDADTCRTHYTQAGKTVLVVIRTKGDYRARRDALAEKLRLPATELDARRALIETTVQATAAKLVGVVGGDGDVVELHFDPAVFERERALAIVRAL